MRGGVWLALVGVALFAGSVVMVALSQRQMQGELERLRQEIARPTPVVQLEDGKSLRDFLVDDLVGQFAGDSEESAAMARSWFDPVSKK